MATKITEVQKQIMAAHMEAEKNSTWDFPKGVSFTKTFLVDNLKSGKTFEHVHEHVKYNFCSITSLLMASPDVLNLPENSAYMKGLRKGYREVLTELGIE